MGVIKYLLLKLMWPTIFGGTATYWAFSLGKELTVASR